ncbi:hypothetical protein V1525DRAFT_459387 [Lipomyces kononenkoae]|uniref:Uncharacterized protein n=1 Tax=Lipomyces kononenkoae TaxID=34357 RepID=A0ACC3SS53_LIPKO
MEREREELMNVVRRPLSPDTQVEVPVSWEVYEQVNDILEREEAKYLLVQYPRLWYDSARSVAIVVASPSDLHSSMAGGLVSRIKDEVMRIQGLDAAMADGLFIRPESTSTRPTRYGLTTRAWDTALVYTEGNRQTIMIAVEVGVSQSYRSLRTAISWWVSEFGCRLGLAMSIHEGPRRNRRLQTQNYVSIEEAEAAVAGLEDELRNQQAQYPYGPLVINGVTWFGRVRNVELETYRAPGDDIPREALLEPTHSFTIVSKGEFVGDSVAPNLRDVVLGDCIPDHIIGIHGMEAMPVSFFRREWFERQFGNGMIENAVNRIWRNTRIGHAA